MSREKDTHKMMCRNSTEWSKNEHKCVKNKTKKAASTAIEEKAEEKIIKIKSCPNGMLRQEKRLKTDSEEVDGGKCMRSSYGKLSISEKR